jgi:hypothetical protein
MIVDFSIEDDSIFPVILKNGLISEFKIDDFQTGSAKGKQIRGENTLLIGTPVEESCHHVPSPLL